MGLTKMAITKIGMAKMLYNQLNISKKDALRITESFFDLIKSELEQSNTVMISGFGKWFVRSKKERRGRNPLTGEEVIIKARKVVTFKSSPNLTSAMNP